MTTIKETVTIPMTTDRDKVLCKIAVSKRRVGPILKAIALLLTTGGLVTSAGYGQGIQDQTRSPANTGAGDHLDPAIAASQVLVKMGRDAVPYVTGLLHDADARVRELAVQTLQRIATEDLSVGYADRR